VHSLPFIYNCCQDKQAFIQELHQALLREYPALQLRWVRIFGPRWAHLYGEAAEASCQAIKIRLNKSYGVCIDNPEYIPGPSLDTLIAQLKERFNDEDLV